METAINIAISDLLHINDWDANQQPLDYESNRYPDCMTDYVAYNIIT